MIRSVSSYVLIVVVCIATIVVACLLWLDHVALDTDAYVHAVAPLWENSAIKEKAADEIGYHLASHVDTDWLVDMWFPALPEMVRPMFADPLRALVEPVAYGLGTQYVSSPDFERVWLEGNRDAHRSLVRQLLASGDIGAQTVSVEIDVANLADDAYKTVFDGAVVSDPPWADTAPHEVEVFDPGEFGLVRYSIRLLHGHSWAAILVLLISIVGAVGVSKDRRATLTRVAIGSAGSMAFTLVGVVAVRMVWVSRLSERNLTPAASGALYDTVVHPLQVGTVSAMLVLLAVGCVLARRRSASEAACGEGS